MQSSVVFGKGSPHYQGYLMALTVKALAKGRSADAGRKGRHAYRRARWVRSRWSDPQLQGRHGGVGRERCQGQRPPHRCAGGRYCCAKALVAVGRPRSRSINGGFPWLEIKCSRCQTPRDVDLCALRHVSTTCVHDLAGRLVCQKCKKAGKRPATTLKQLTPRQRHTPTKE
jgi:hypothetical protein